MDDNFVQIVQFLVKLVQFFEPAESYETNRQNTSFLTIYFKWPKRFWVSSVS